MCVLSEGTAPLAVGRLVFEGGQVLHERALVHEAHGVFDGPEIWGTVGDYVQRLLHQGICKFKVSWVTRLCPRVLVARGAGVDPEHIRGTEPFLQKIGDRFLVVPSAYVDAGARVVFWVYVDR